jgi:hypothetical protein
VSPAARRVAATVVAVVLAAVAVWCLTRGIETRLSTGGLLTAPVPRTTLRGGWLLGAAAAGTVAILVALEAGSGLTGRWRRRG